MFDRMFDEKSDIWLRVYKVITIFIFFALAFAGVLMAMLALGEDSPLNLFSNSFGSWLFWIAVGAVSAFFTLFVNMLTLQKLTNLQEMRKISDGTYSSYDYEEG